MVPFTYGSNMLYILSHNLFVVLSPTVYDTAIVHNVSFWIPQLNLSKTQCCSHFSFKYAQKEKCAQEGRK